MNVYWNLVAVSAATLIVRRLLTYVFARGSRLPGFEGLVPIVLARFRESRPHERKGFVHLCEVSDSEITVAVHYGTTRPSSRVLYRIRFEIESVSPRSDDKRR